MNANIKEKLTSYLNQSVNDYMTASAMDKCGVWATDEEIMATASLISTDIIVYAKHGKNMQWLIYPASFSLQETTETAIYLENRSDHFSAVLGVE